MDSRTKNKEASCVARVAPEWCWTDRCTYTQWWIPKIDSKEKDFSTNFVKNKIFVRSLLH